MYNIHCKYFCKWVNIEQGKTLKLCRVVYVMLMYLCICRVSNLLFVFLYISYFM